MNSHMSEKKVTGRKLGLLSYTDEFIEAIEKWDGSVGAPNAENKKKTAIQIYMNPFIENYLASAHPIVPGLWAIPLATYGLYVGFTAPNLGLWSVLGLFALGVLLWTLTEYMLHRFVFHIRPTDDFNSKFKMFMMHGYHHEFPNDKYRLVAPPLMSWPPTVIIGSIYYLVAGPYAWLPLLAGSAIGYLGYDWIHYYTHHFRPTSRLGKYLRRLHMVHHFQEFEKNHGISTPLWDFVFSTYFDKKRSPKNENATSE